MVNDSSYYRRKAKCGGMDSKSIQRLRELEREPARLKRIVADQMLDITMLRDINSKNWQSPKSEEALNRLICLNGRPKTIKSDNGSEFRSRYMEKWSKERGITLEFTSPGKPTENGQIESFNGTMRNEILRGVEFESVREARDELDKWREKYNNERPHTALNYEPPSTRHRPHGGDTNRFNLEPINPTDDNINQVNLLPWLPVLILGTAQPLFFCFASKSLF